MPQLQACARRIDVRNATQIMINAANEASETRNPARDDCNDSIVPYTPDAELLPQTSLSRALRSTTVP
jgi:hypothetical protein